jgi:hypothetical protein
MWMQHLMMKISSVLVHHIDAANMDQKFDSLSVFRPIPHLAAHLVCSYHAPSMTQSWITMFLDPAK